MVCAHSLWRLYIQNYKEIKTEIREWRAWNRTVSPTFGGLFKNFQNLFKIFTPWICFKKK